MKKSETISINFICTSYYLWEFQFQNYVQGQENCGDLLMPLPNELQKMQLSLVGYCIRWSPIDMQNYLSRSTFNRMMLGLSNQNMRLQNTVEGPNLFRIPNTMNRVCISTIQFTQQSLLTLWDYFRGYMSPTQHHQFLMKLR